MQILRTNDLFISYNSQRLDLYNWYTGNLINIILGYMLREFRNLLVLAGEGAVQVFWHGVDGLSLTSRVCPTADASKTLRVHNTLRRENRSVR